MIANVVTAGQACRNIGFCVRCGRGPPSVSDATDPRFAETAWSIVLDAGASTPARMHTAMADLQNLLATHLRLPAPQRPLDARRRRFNTTIFSAPVGKRDAPARFARERTLPQFPPWSAETLPGGRTRGATHFETRRRNAIHFNG